MICTFCFLKKATELHHYFANTKANKKKYGKALMENHKNKTSACNDCNGSHRKAINWQERKFCKVMGILECRYCKKDIPGGCLWNEGAIAENCRYYQFDREKKENENVYAKKENDRDVV